MRKVLTTALGVYAEAVISSVAVALSCDHAIDNVRLHR